MLRRFTPQEAFQAFESCLGAVWDMKQRQVPGHSAEFHKWKGNAEAAIERAYGPDSIRLRNFLAIPFVLNPSVPGLLRRMGDPEHSDLFDRAVAQLQSMRDEVQLEMGWEMSEEEKQWKHGKALDQASAPTLRTAAQTVGNRVFVVHGRDFGTKEKAARFLDRLGLEPIILHEQPNRSRTIIEKFEIYSDVGFAVVLLTADDVGRLKADSEPLNPRARQNVIFEFGYFIGKIGRDRVCALLEAGVDKPSDLDGIVYVPLDPADAWKMQLVKELKAAGYTVDANKAL